MFREAFLEEETLGQMQAVGVTRGTLDSELCKNPGHRVSHSGGVVARSQNQQRVVDRIPRQKV